MDIISGKHFVSLSLGIKHHCPDFSICGMFEEEPGELLLHSELISPTSGTPERCLVTIDSLIRGETYLQRVSGHLKSSPTLRDLKTTWISVKCLRLSKLFIFTYG